MSTTVSYKGETLATLTNATKTLNTAGTWVEGDITVTDSTAGINLQSKTGIAPSTASQTVSADAGYDGLSTVQINAMPAGSVTSPSTITGTGATLTTGTNTLTLGKTISVTPNVTTSGYVTSGTAGNANVSLTATVSTTGAQTFYPSTADQTITSGRYLTGTQTFKKVTTTNISASNIRSGVTIKVGDATDDDRIISVLGTYTGAGVNLQAKSSSYTPSETAISETITPDSGYDGLSSFGISIAGISSNYVGSGITRRDSSDLSVSGAKVTAPAGYYSAAASANVASGTATAPSSISGTSALITTSQPLSGQPTITLKKNSLLVTPSVTPGYIAFGTAGSTAVELTASINAVYGSTTFYPSTESSVIREKSYFTEDVSIEPVTVVNLIPSNIKSGVTIEVGCFDDTDCIASVTGTYTGGATNYVEGTFTPGTTAGWVDLSIPYTGSSYPVALTIVVDGGCYDSTITAWYDLVSRYAIGMFNITKADFSTAPTYATSSSTTTTVIGNRGVVMSTYKNSTSSATTYTRAGAMTAASYCSSMTATVGAGSAAMFKSNKIIRYYAQGSGTSYGFAKNVTYRYMVTYYQ